MHHLPFVPENDRLRVLAARILRRDGTEVSARQSDTPRLAEPEFNLFYDTRLRVLRFPELEADGATVEGDPVWRMPSYTPYESMIEPGIADLDNAPKGGFAGSITGRNTISCSSTSRSASSGGRTARSASTVPGRARFARSWGTHHSGMVWSLKTSALANFATARESGGIIDSQARTGRELIIL